MISNTSDNISKVDDQFARAVLVDHESRIGSAEVLTQKVARDLESLQRDVRMGFTGVIVLGIVEGFLKYFHILG